jgi:glycosyltransferase involved in cell wall biosynthesis
MKACQALAQLGHELHLLVPGTTSETGGKTTGSVKEAIEDLASYYGTQTPFHIEWLLSLSQFRRYDFSLRAIRRAQSLKADLVYVWPLQAAVFSLLWRMPTLIEMHGPPEGRFGPRLFQMFIKIPGKKRSLPITQALVSILERDYGFSFRPGEMIISPNAVDLERYRDLPDPSTARRTIGLRDIPTVGYTGHLYSGRGMELLLELAMRHPQVQFLWVGGRPRDVQVWQEELSSKDISNVTLTGFVENSQLPLYQAAADILLMPYDQYIEGSSGGNSADYCSPMKMFEYMACGRAIISSDLPVIQEVLDQSNAILCPPGDIQSWSQGLEKLINEPEERSRLSQHAQRDGEAYTWISRAQNALQGFV